MSKTKRTLSKSKRSKSGLSVKEELMNLNTSISIAKGMLAILSSRLQSLSIRPSIVKVDAQHLLILSQDAMDEIWNADLIVERLMSDPRPRLTV